ncbi:hypothetical protein NP603_06715 [Methylomonas sp. SURF-1]|uniref:SGNH/GDSL hydrolase family protein n=1 Tax=Methylomonas aurea TaxID=2952224 RepID=A0ABT1UEZ4_9GAMM|nr:hypothetical protein [Methylomonas sp. SURF-1]MCQ8180793.1 hypothetical protein [Methylomonas sp. SURF-1]
MPSFISNSSDRLPNPAVKRAFGFGLLVAVLLLAVVELRLRQIGFRPTVQDSKELWAAQRGKAALLGKQALILVGDSRMQLGMDLDVLAVETGLTPVQLAIDGSEFLPVLADMAQDPAITGKLLVSGDVWKLAASRPRDRAEEWVEFYHRKYKDLVSAKLETLLKSQVQQQLALYGGGIPPQVLFERLTSPGMIRPFYLTTYANRERDADYELVQQPAFYINRVLRSLGQPVDMAGIDTREKFEHAVGQKLRQSAPSQFSADQFAYTHGLSRQIQNKGGQLAFINFPSTALVRTIEEYRYPRASGWDVFSANSPALAVNCWDYPEFAFELPDGAHLDRRDKAEFTRRLVARLKASAFFD